MRRQLTSLFGSTSEADEALKLLLTHLATAGFGEHKRGRLRDFLLRGIRSAAKTRVEEAPADDRPLPKLDELTLESKQWVKYWREGLLERAWRAMERQEPADPEPPVYSLLHYATANRQATPEELASIISENVDVEIDARSVQETLPHARALFAQLVADEVAETLESPTGEDVKREIGQLGLARAFNGIAVADEPE